MEESTVQAIKQRNAKSGEGAKGPWQQDIVILDTGEEVRMFAPVEVGDVVESYQNGNYTNWRLKDGAQSGPGGGTAPRQSTDGSITTDQIYAEVLKQGKLLKEINDRLKVLTGEEVDTVETPEVVQAAEDKRVANTQAEPDVVIEDIGDEPINLDDIPF